MPIEANYEIYYGINLNHYQYTWGGISYNNFLLTEYPDSNLVSTVTTNITTLDFIYPRLITNKTYLDGTAEGHFTLYNNDPSSATAISSYTVTLLKTTDVPSSIETIGSYTNDISSTSNIIASKGYLTLPIYIVISKKPLNENEKIILRIAYTSSNTNICICHANDNSDVDIKIKIPFAPTG